MPRGIGYAKLTTYCDRRKYRNKIEQFKSCSQWGIESGYNLAKSELKGAMNNGKHNKRKEKYTSSNIKELYL